jgi:alkylated DNA repair protein (DNA oxidative demethylase)
MSLELFGTARPPEILAPGAMLLPGFVGDADRAVLDAIRTVASEAPFRHMVTPGGHRMSVAMTNCGAVGWVTDHRGYRYDPIDPESGRPWPAMPAVLRELAKGAAVAGGYAGFDPDGCLINRYVPGAKLSLHQDRDERDLEQPIVSVSLGLPATFQFGGLQRADAKRRVRLSHGDVVVWGGPSRLVYHGILTLKKGEHELVGAARLNLTFRKAA